MRGLAAGGTGKLKGTRAEQAEKAPASESGRHKIKSASKFLGALFSFYLLQRSKRITEER
jgi:hypothetical protein